MTKDFAIEAKIWNENDSIHLPSDIHKHSRKRFENPQDTISWQNKNFHTEERYNQSSELLSLY